MEPNPFGEAAFPIKMQTNLALFIFSKASANIHGPLYLFNYFYPKKQNFGIFQNLMGKNFKCSPIDNITWGKMHFSLVVGSDIIR